MPSTVQDARDLLISSVLCPDPVIYIDDRWLYEQTANLKPIKETPLNAVTPKCLKEGDQITIVGSGYSTLLALNASKKLNSELPPKTSKNHNENHQEPSKSQQPWF